MGLSFAVVSFSLLSALMASRSADSEALLLLRRLELERAETLSLLLDVIRVLNGSRQVISWSHITVKEDILKFLKLRYPDVDLTREKTLLKAEWERAVLHETSRTSSSPPLPPRNASCPRKSSRRKISQLVSPEEGQVYINTMTNPRSHYSVFIPRGGEAAQEPEKPSKKLSCI